MILNRSKSTLVVLFLCLLASGSALALSPEAASILSRQNRKLEAVPRSLRASEANVDLRYASGQRRLAANHSAAISDPELETIPVTNPKDYRDYSRPSSSSMRFDMDSARSKLDRVFGLGFMSAGAYGVFGMEVDFALLEEWTFGFGLGTGMDYSSWGAHTRYQFRKAAALSPFVELGYANWTLDKVSDRHTSELTPSHLAQRFFSKDAAGRLVEGDTAHIFYPGIGINYMMASGLSLVGQAQYMIHMGDFSGGLTASAGIYYYF